MKRFKKILSFFLAIVLLLSSAPVDVHATESSDETVISVESKYTVVGEEVSVDVLIENNPGILGATLEFSYAEELTLVSATAGEAFSNLSMTKPPKFQSPCRFIWDGTDGVAKDGTILTLKFSVAEDAELEKAFAISVAVPGGEIIDDNMNYVETTTKNGSVTVVDFKAGDANGDGLINITDVITTRRHLVGYEININENAANVNDDGKVSISDVIVLRRYLAGGYDVEPLYPTVLLCNHVMEETPYKAPTCTEEGVNKHWYCTECHKFYSDVYGNHEMTEEATKIAKVDHTWVIVPQVNPDYGVEGSTEGKYCSVCGFWEVPVEPIPPLVKNEYSITYDLNNVVSYNNNGDVTVMDDSYLTSLNLATLNPNPLKYTNEDGLELSPLNVEGFTFKGWYTTIDGGTPITEIPAGSTGTKTIYGRWEPIPYTITFDCPDVEYRREGKDITVTAEYTVNKGFSFGQNPECYGYMFVGWSNNEGFILDKIEPGTTEDIELHANWTSERNRAVSYAKYGEPLIIEDDVNGQFLFVYDIGKFVDVPFSVIDPIGKTNKVDYHKSMTVTNAVESTQAEKIAEMVSEATTRSSGWTLSEEWEKVYSAGTEQENIQGKTEVRTDSQGNVVGGNYFVSNSSGGSTYVSTESGSSSAYSSKVTTEDSVGINGSYDASTRKYVDAKLGVENKTEAGVGAKFPVDIINVSAELKNTTTINAEVSSGREDNTAVHVDSQMSSYVGTVNTNSGSSYYNVSTNDSSTWNSTSGYEESYSTSIRTDVTSEVSSAISETTKYNLSNALGNTNITTETVEGEDTKTEEYSTTLAYSQKESRSETRELTYESDVAGYYRVVQAGTVHVYGVVGYDIATSSYYTYTYNVAADETYDMLDYSMEDGNFADCQNGVVTFEIPFEVFEYVSNFAGKTNGMKFDLNGCLTGFDSTKDPQFDGTVVLPEYYSKDDTAYKLTSFNADVFKGNTEIKKVILPKYITEIPDRAFEGCTNLESVVAYGVTKIGAYAFKDCTNLEDFSIDNMIVEIGEKAFDGVGKLVQKVNADGSYVYEKVGEIKVMAANADVADAVIKSGAKYITLDISKMEDSKDKDGNVTNSYNNDKAIEIPEGTEYFKLISDGKSYNNLQLKSNASETYIKKVNFVNNEKAALELNSEKVILNQVKVEEASGFALILPENNTELYLYGIIGIGTTSENAVISKNVTLYEEDETVDSKLQITGNYLIYGTLTNESYLKFTSGKLKTITKNEFENKLTSVTVTFDAKGGTVSETSRIVSRDAQIGELPIPEKTGYDFVGWYFEGGSQVTSNTTFSTDTTIYARWNVKEYRVSWEGGTGKNISVNRTSSPYAIAENGELSNGDTIYYGDELQVTYATLDGWSIESYGAEKITVTKDVTSSDIYMTVWSNWSDWSTSAVSESSNTAVETKIQYRYSDKDIKESTSASLDGWTCYNSETVYGNWGDWYGWVEAQAPAASDTCQVEVTRFWRYYYLKCPQCGAEEGLYGTSDCGWKSLNSSHMVVGWSRTPYSATGYQIYQHAAWKAVTHSNNLIQENIMGYNGITPGHTWYFNAPDESKQEVGAISGDSNDVIIRAFSRWRTRSKSLKYYHYKWSDWSEWNDTEYSANDERQVETRTMYRYKTRY